MEAVIGLIRPYFEIAYFAAGVLLILGLALTYRQLRLIQNDVDTRNARAAKEKAIEACLRYGNAYVPLASKLYNALEKTDGKGGYNGPIGDFSQRSIVSDRLTAVIATESTEIIELAVNSLNELELCAAYFVTEVADEKVGFSTIGRTFCRTVENHYDIIAVGRKNLPNDHWSSIIKLYRLWRPRLHKSELEAKATLLKKQIEAIDS